MSFQSAGLTAGAVILLCYLFFLGQIGVHNCVHMTLLGSRRANKLLGTMLGSLLLVHFEGWRVAHMNHHRFANTDRDPHHVDRPLVPYLLTHYFRIARYVWEPKRFFAAIAPPILLAATVIWWQVSIGHPGRGVRWVVLFWLVPIFVSHLLVAHFNYSTHVRLPSGRGRDTRSFHRGIWNLVNRLTFNFYLHQEHHLHPDEAIPQPRPQFYNLSN